MYEIIAKFRNNIELSESDLADIAYLNVHRKFLSNFLTNILLPTDLDWVKKAILSPDPNVSYFASLLLPHFSPSINLYIDIFRQISHPFVKIRIIFLILAMDNVPKAIFVESLMFLSSHLIELVHSCIQWYQITEPRLLINKYLSLLASTDKEFLKLLYDCVITAIITMQEEM